MGVVGNVLGAVDAVVLLKLAAKAGDGPFHLFLRERGMAMFALKRGTAREAGEA